MVILDKECIPSAKAQHTGDIFGDQHPAVRQRSRKAIGIFEMDKMCIRDRVLGVSMITGCSTGGQKESGTVKIATKPMTEQLILGEMLSILIQENTDLNVEITKGVGGGTSNIHPALIKGDFDLYPEYTGTAWNNILKKTEYPDDETLWNTLTDEYDAQFGLKWVGMYGFNNTYTLALRKEIADKYNIKTFSDMARYTPEITFGANPDFYEREDGYQALCDAYGFSFKDHMDCLLYTSKVIIDQWFIG